MKGVTAGGVVDVLTIVGASIKLPEYFYIHLATNIISGSIKSIRYIKKKALETSLD